MVQDSTIPTYMHKINILALFLVLILFSCNPDVSGSQEQESQSQSYFIPVFSNVSSSFRAVLSEDEMAMISYYARSCPLVSFEEVSANKGEELFVEFMGYEIPYSIAYDDGKIVCTGIDEDESIWFEVSYDPQNNQFEYRHGILVVDGEVSSYALCKTKEPVTLNDGTYGCSIDGILYEVVEGMEDIDKLNRYFGETYSSDTIVGSMMFARYSKPEDKKYMETYTGVLEELEKYMKDRSVPKEFGKNILDNIDEYFPSDNVDMKSCGKNMHYGIKKDGNGFNFKMYNGYDDNPTSAQDVVDAVENGVFKGKWILQDNFIYDQIP